MILRFLKKNFSSFISHLISLSSKISCSQKQKKLHQLFFAVVKIVEIFYVKKYDGNGFFGFSPFLKNLRENDSPVSKIDISNLGFVKYLEAKPEILRENSRSKKNQNLKFDP